MFSKKDFNISKRSNVLQKTIKTEYSKLKQVVIYEDHRTNLIVLSEFINSNDINEPIDLIMFDDHDDFITPSIESINSIKNYLKKPTKEKLLCIVEFELRPLDDDWVKAGMELGLINNVFLFNSSKSGISIKEEYQTSEYGVKKMYNMGNVWDAISYRGILNDPIKNEEKEELYSDFGWQYKDESYSFIKERKPFILDIDLDCFSVELMDKTIAIPEQIIIPLLTNSIYPDHHNFTSTDLFIKELVHSSKLVTMCFESDSCGGINESHQIFTLIDEIIFDNQLG